MAVLSDNDRAALTAECQRDNDFRLEGWPVTKAQLRSVINALDQFLEDNAAAINSAIPQPQRGLLSQKQKAFLLRFVIRRRYEVT